MKIRVEYNHKTQNLKIFYDEKLHCGMIGPIAEMRYKAIKAEIERINILKNINGHKEEKTKI